MKHLSAKIDDKDMDGLDTLVRHSDRRDRSYFVRNAIKQYLHNELPKVLRKHAPDSLKMNLTLPDVETPEDPKS